MKTKLSLAIIAIVAVLGGIYYYNTKPVALDPAPTETEQPTELTAITGSGTYALDTEASAIHGRGKKPLIAGYVDYATVKFSEGTATVVDGAITAATGIIDMASLKGEKTGKGTGESMLEGHLKSPDFFDVEKYPTATFALVSAERDTVDTSGRTYNAKANLTIKGITQAIEFPISVGQRDGKIVATANIKLDRTKWDIRYGSGKFLKDLGDKVIDDIFELDVELVSK